MPIPGNNQQMNLNINKKDIIDAENEVCECGCKLFRQACVIKKVPGFILGMGQDTVMIPMDVMVCNKCGELAPSIKNDPNMENILNGKKKEERPSGLVI